MLGLRAALSPDDRQRQSREACARLRELPLWEQASVVAAYHARDDEMDPAPALAAARDAGKVVAYPRVTRDKPRLRFHRVADPGQLVAGSFGLREPPDDAPEVPPASIDLFIVPGLAFDASGGRLGFGKGYYDELLAALEATGERDHTLLVGLAYGFQLLPRIPTGIDDRPVDLIVTQAQVIRAK